MLRFSSRWHNAANSPLLGEARLLLFANGGTPGEGGPEAESGAPEEAQHPLHQRTQATHASVEEVLQHQGDSEGNEAEATIEKTRATVDKLAQKLANFHSTMESVKKEVKKKTPSGEQPYVSEEMWKEMKEFLDEKLNVLSDAKKDLSVVDRIQEKQNTQIPPINIIASVRAELDQERQALIDSNENTDLIDKHQEALDRAEAAIRAGDLPDGTTPDRWERLSFEERMKVYKRMDDVLGMDETLEQISHTSDALLKEIDERQVDKLLKDIQEKIKKKEEGDLRWHHAGNPIAHVFHQMEGIKENIKQTLGIEFYTPMQLYLAFKELQEAFHEVHTQHQRLQASKLAALGGRALAPILGHNFERILENAQVKKNDEVKNGFLEALKSNSWDPGFDGMFSPGGLLDTHMHDKNHTRAILEFAASKGMLYDLTEEHAVRTQKLFGRWNYRDLVPSEWTDDQVNSYWGNLLGANTTGADARAKIGYEFASPIEQAGKFIERIDEFMKGHDLWFVKGIIERAFDKGKSSNLSPWIAVTVMEHMRSDPLLRKIVPIAWLDKVGVISAKTVAFTLGHLNFQRTQYIYPWTRSPDTSMYGAGSLGRVIEEVKKDILSKDKALDPDKFIGEKAKEVAQVKLNKLVSLVLATEIVQVGDGKGEGNGGGKYVSIFDKRYDFYNKGSDLQRDDEVDVKKLSDDFYDNRSEILMCKSSLIAKILEYDNKREFVNVFRTRKVLTHALDILKELEEKASKSPPAQAAELRSALERFRTTFGAKMQSFFYKVFNQTNLMPLTGFTLGDDRTPALMAMVRAGFVPLSVLQEGWDTGKRDTREFVLALLRQLTDPTMEAPKEIKESARKMFQKLSPPTRRRDEPSPGAATDMSQPTIAP